MCKHITENFRYVKSYFPWLPMWRSHHRRSLAGKEIIPKGPGRTCTDTARRKQRLQIPSYNSFRYVVFSDADVPDTFLGLIGERR